MSAIEQRVNELMKAGRSAEALELLTSALRKSESSGLWNDWASAAYACGDTNLAESGFRRALQLDRLHRQAAVNLATLLLRQRRFDEGVPVLESLLGRLTLEEGRALQELMTKEKTAQDPGALTAVDPVAPRNPVARSAAILENPTRIRIVIIRPDGYLHSEAFAEFAETLCLGLRGVGLSAEVEWNRFAPGAVNLVLGWHLLGERALPPRCILYNLEQLGEHDPTLQSRLMNPAGHCELWDYSQRNIRILDQCGCPVAPHHVAIGAMPSLSRISPAPQQDIDVLYLGSINARQAKVIQALKVVGLEVKALFGIYGAARDALIARAKVILNVNPHDTSAFGIVPASYLWMNRKAVVAERCKAVAIEIEDDLKEAALFVPYDQLVAACQQLVADTGLRKDLEQSAFEAMSKRDEVAILRNVLMGSTKLTERQTGPPAVIEISGRAAERAVAVEVSARAQHAHLRVGVITPSVPERQRLLIECRASVSAQTSPPQLHQVQLDLARRGPSAVRNQLVSSLPQTVDWIAFLDDDDLLLPGHLERLAAAASNSDIVYSQCHIDGPAVPWRIQPFDPKLLQHTNYIPVTVLMRRRLFEDLKGFRDLGRDEDWDLWKRAAKAGARFTFIDEATWVYRMRAQSRTFCGFINGGMEAKI